MQPREFHLDTEFICSVDSMNENEWNTIICDFRDATVNQTWSYGQIRSKNNSHLVVKKNGTVVAAAMIRLYVLPIVGCGIAYISYGPMWKLRGKPDDTRILENIIKGLKEEYSIRRKLLLRISTYIFTNHTEYEALRSTFNKQGFSRKEMNQTTFILDLAPSLEELRKRLHQKWRNLLNNAEKNNLTIREGTESELFSVFRTVYNEMLDRKQYLTDVDIDEYELIQKALPQELKLRIVVCESDGCPMAGAVFSSIGDTGIYLLGATSNEGMTNKASYLLQWHIIKYFKENGFRAYDLGGCNPNTYKGTYHFKAGICGKHPDLFSNIGVMEICKCSISRFLSQTINIYRRLRTLTSR